MRSTLSLTLGSLALLGLAAPAAGHTDDPAHSTGAAATTTSSASETPADDPGCDLPDPPPPAADWASGVSRSLGWLPASSTVWYRATTLEEQRANGWGSGSFVMVAPKLFEAATGGAERVDLTLPLSPGEVRVFQLELRGSEAVVSYSETRMSSVGPKVFAFTPTFFTYRQPGFDADAPDATEGALLRLTGDDHGGVAASGVVGNKRFELLGPFRAEKVQLDIPAPWGLGDLIVGTWTQPEELSLIEDGGICDGWIAPPMHSNPQDECYEGPKKTHTCNDGINNDNPTLGKQHFDPHAGGTDASDPSCFHHDDYGCGWHKGHTHRYEAGKTFGLFGDVRYCHQAEDAWWTRMHQIGESAAITLNAIDTGNAAIEATHGVYEFRLGAGHCWFFEVSDDVLDACHDDGVNCPSQAYPYAGVGDDASSYLDAVWDDVNHTGSIPSGIKVPLDVAVVLTILVRADGYGRAGVARGPDWPEVSERGSVVAATATSLGENTISVNYAATNVAHEVGHAVGMQHDSVSDGNTLGLMATSGGKAPVVSDANKGRLASAFFDDEHAPRRSGLGWIGCNDDWDCSPAHLSHKYYCGGGGYCHLEEE